MGLGGYEKGSGVSAAKFLAPRCKKLIITDVKTKEELAKNVRALSRYKNIVWHLGGHREEDFIKTDWVIRNPGVRADNPFLAIAKKHKIPIDNDVTLFLRLLGSAENVIGITGTRGKTTTAHLIHAMIAEEYPRAWLGGNVGRSPLSLRGPMKSARSNPDGVASSLRGATPRNDGNRPIILELSSFLLHNFDSIKQSPHIAVLTNLYPDHLNAYSSLQKYFADKKNIYQYQKRGDVLIINDDDALLKKLAPLSKGTEFRFSLRRKLREGCYVEKGKVVFYHSGASEPDHFVILEEPAAGDDRIQKLTGSYRLASRASRMTKETVCRLSDLKLLGEHNIANLLGAVCAAKAYGISNAAIRRAVKKFNGVPYRLELVRTVRGVKYVNDTTATTPEGAIAGLKSFPAKKIVLITGGNSKGLSLAQFAKEIRARAKTVILLPGNANKDLPRGITIGHPERGSLSRVEGSHVVNGSTAMREAVRLASLHAKRGDVVLLSPGLSWLPVMNEFQRGDEFTKWVRRLK